jgi:hypothetical protein
MTRWRKARRAAEALYLELAAELAADSPPAVRALMEARIQSRIRGATMAPGHPIDDQARSSRRDPTEQVSADPSPGLGVEIEPVTVPVSCSA